MPDLTLRTLDDAQTQIDSDRLRSLTDSLAGTVVTPESADYDEVRAAWNGMIDRRPGLILRCHGSDDVVEAVRFGREHGLLTAVRGAGHHIAGNSVCDGGLMIDLGPMNSVEVDPEERTARVGPGATLGDFDGETQKFGLATPVGINSTTGIAGLTLGGGFGWLTRKYGMTVDNLLSVDVVTASGERMKASAEENPDLFWGLRGGSGNFGVVTSFEFQLHPVGPEVLSGLIVHPYDRAESVMQAWREFVADAPDELAVWAVLRKAPPLPFLPEEVHGTEVVVLAALYAGDMADGEKALQPLRDFGDPIADAIMPHPYTGFQAAFDPLLTPGARNYWKSHDFTEVSDGLIDKIVEYAGKLPTDQCEIFVAHLGGAMTRVPSDATAYPHRNAEFIMNVHTRWEDPALDDECVGWAREFFRETTPFATGGVYVNFLTQDETERVRSAYGGNYDRLVELKNRYDPDNFFRLNQNIRPTAAA